MKKRKVGWRERGRQKERVKKARERREERLRKKRWIIFRGKFRELE